MKTRNLVNILTLFVSFNLALSACGKAAPASPTGGSVSAASTTAGALTATAPLNKNITIVIPDDPPSFNAVIANTGYDILVMKLVLLGMTGIDSNGNVYPELAAELPTAQNGEVVQNHLAGTMSVTWKMRQDVKWADGTPVTSDDVLFTYKAIIDPTTGNFVPGLDVVLGVDRIDNYTFKVNYKSIYPSYLTQFGGEQIAVWPAHYCNPKQGFSAWDCARTPLSDGPFILKEWVQGDHLTFVKNSNYYQAGKPDIEGITVKIVPDASVRKKMMLNGDADINMWTDESVTADLQKAANVKVSISPNSRYVMRLFMNGAKKGTTNAQAHPHPVLSDVRVRQAIRMAVDVQAISQQFFNGYSEPVWTEFFRPPYDQCSIPQPKYDPEAAKLLLEQAGWTDPSNKGVRECHGCTTGAPVGYPMEMQFLTYQEYGQLISLTQQLIAEDLRKIGIKLDLSAVPSKVLFASAKNGGIEQTGNYDIDLWDDGYSGVDPTAFIAQYYSADSIAPDSGSNVMRWKNDPFTALVNNLYTLDESERQKNFCQMAKILDQQVPLILMFTTLDADAYSTRLAGVQATVNDVVSWNAADWKVVK